MFNGSQKFLVTPDSGYFIANLYVDTGFVGPKNSYTFEEVKENHTINATFSQSPNPAPTLHSLEPGSAHRGETVTVLFEGTNFTIGATTVTLGTGFTLNKLVYFSPESLSANITVAANAAVGGHYFFVTNGAPGGGTDSLLFTVSNNVPSEFEPVKPADGDTIQLTTIPGPINFTWHPSADLDAADTLQYSIRVQGQGLDTTVSGLRDTSVILGIMPNLQVATKYTWSVSVTDGFNTVGPFVVSFRTSDVVLAVDDRGRRIPTEYALHQNYPNPFNQTTVIQLDLPRQSVVTLKVYNLLGQEVAALIDGTSMSAGVHDLTFNASSVPSGVYLYRVTAEGSNGKMFVSVKKLMLLK